MLATPSLFNQHLPPLADRVRPQSLSGFIGQSHLIDPDKILSKLLEKEQLFSLLFWGPPGTGKTTLARIIANNLKAEMHEFRDNRIDCLAGMFHLKQCLHRIKPRGGFHLAFSIA